jgi:hypothetical protein
MEWDAVRKFTYRDRRGWRRLDNIASYMMFDVAARVRGTIIRALGSSAGTRHWLSYGMHEARRRECQSGDPLRVLGLHGSGLSCGDSKEPARAGLGFLPSRNWEGREARKSRFSVASNIRNLPAITRFWQIVTRSRACQIVPTFAPAFSLTPEPMLKRSHGMHVPAFLVHTDEDPLGICGNICTTPNCKIADCWKMKARV